MAFLSTWRMVASISATEEAVVVEASSRLGDVVADPFDGGRHLDHGGADFIHRLAQLVGIKCDLLNAGGHLQD
jgi:hypothetical protein